MRWAPLIAASGWLLIAEGTIQLTQTEIPAVCDSLEITRDETVGADEGVFNVKRKGEAAPSFDVRVRGTGVLDVVQPGKSCSQMVYASKFDWQGEELAVENGGSGHPDCGQFQTRNIGDDQEWAEIRDADKGEILMEFRSRGNNDGFSVMTPGKDCGFERIGWFEAKPEAEVLAAWPPGVSGGPTWTPSLPSIPERTRFDRSPVMKGLTQFQAAPSPRPIASSSRPIKADDQGSSGSPALIGLVIALVVLVMCLGVYALYNRSLLKQFEQQRATEDPFPDTRVTYDYQTLPESAM